MLDLAVTLDPGPRRRLLEEASRRCDALGPSNLLLRAAVLNARGTLEVEASHVAVAAEFFASSDEILSSLPPTSPERMTLRHNLAATYTRLGQWDRAEPVQRELVELRQQIHGENSDITASARENWAVTLTHQRRYREAEEAFTRALATFESTLDPQHWRISNAVRNVGQILALQGRYAEALPHLDRAIDIRRSFAIDEGFEHLRAQRAMVWLGLGQVDRAHAELTEVVAALTQPGAGFHPAYAADASIWLAVAELRRGRTEDARAHFEHASQLRADLYDDDHPRRAEARLGLTLTGAAVPGVDLEADRRRYRSWGLSHPLLLELLDEYRP
jgi:tetratricopeptide (TPR) repeat protein